MSKYDDIINLPHHVSKNRTPMSMENRAAQFAPFAALTGHDEALAETARLTTPKKLLSDDEMASLTRELARVIEQVPEQEEYTFVYFVPDTQKDGGKYVSITGTAKKYEEVTRALTLSDGRVLLIDNILSIRRLVLRSFNRLYQSLVHQNTQRPGARIKTYPCNESVIVL